MFSWKGRFHFSGEEEILGTAAVDVWTQLQMGGTHLSNGRPAKVLADIM
jgi:hypothetical protein